MHGSIRLIARVTALLGGLVLVGLIVLTTASIIGRSANKWLHSDMAQKPKMVVYNFYWHCGRSNHFN